MTNCCAAVTEPASCFTLASFALSKAEKQEAWYLQTVIPHWHAGATVYQPLDSSNKHWLSLDPPVRVILARLLDPQPKNRLTADQVLAQPWVYQAQERSCPFYCVGPSYMPPGQANTDDDSLLSKWSVPSSVYESERDMHSSDMASNEDFAESNILPRGQEVPGAVGRSSTSSQPSSKPHSQTASPYADRSNTEVNAIASLSLQLSSCPDVL